MDEIVGNISDLQRNPDGSVTITKAGVWQIGRCTCFTGALGLMLSPACPIHSPRRHARG